jgi:hypothetical protein
MNHRQGQASIAISIPLVASCYRYAKGIFNVTDEKDNISLKVLTSKIPYYYLREPAILLCVHTGKKPERRHYPVLSDDYWHFINQCWSATTRDRPSTEQLVEMIRGELELLSKAPFVRTLGVSFSMACLLPL